jgi:hypothetical protein
MFRLNLYFDLTVMGSGLSFGRKWNLLEGFETYKGQLSFLCWLEYIIVSIASLIIQIEYHSKRTTVGTRVRYMLEWSVQMIYHSKWITTLTAQYEGNSVMGVVILYIRVNIVVHRKKRSFHLVYSFNKKRWRRKKHAESAACNRNEK